MPDRVRFTIVELMIVVAIIAILVAIAVPALREFQLRSRRAELEPNVEGIMAALVGYHAAHDEYPLTSSAGPAGTPGKTARPWPAAGFPVFNDVGWKPDGAVRATYRVMAYWQNGGTYCGGAIVQCWVTTIRPCAGGLANMDGDANQQCGAVDGMQASFVWNAPLEVY